MKVVWICGFTNTLIQDKLKPIRRTGEIAPWITNLITLFEDDPTLELHIISTHAWIPLTKSLSIKNIQYHFVPQGIPILGLNWPKYFPLDFWIDYFFIKKRVKKIVDNIQPNIIHLHGAENTYHTSSIIQFKRKYPVLITVQGFLHKISPDSKSRVIQRRIKRELYIYRNFKHFGYRTQIMKEILLEYNRNAKLHYHQYMYDIPVYSEPEEEKEFDIAYFAKITKQKGIIDLLKAIRIIKEFISEIKVLVIGSGTKSFMIELKKICDQTGISNSILWAGFLEKQLDVHKMVSKSKLTVLPTKYDMIPGTIIESMFLKIPVVAYNTGSIPEINDKGFIIKTVELNDIKGLAAAIIELLYNKDLRIKMANDGYRRAKEMFVNKNIKEDILSAYRGTIIDF